MGLLKVASTLPNLFSPFAGPLAERVNSYRRAMLRLDLASAAVVGSIPLLHILGIDSFGLLFAVALLGSALGVLYTVISLSYLKSLVGEHRLTEAKTQLQALDWAARILGPALAGALLGFLPPAIAVTVDGLSFLLSAGALKLLRTPEHLRPGALWPPEPTKKKRKAKFADGLKFAFTEPILQVIYTTVIPLNIAFSAVDANWIIFLVS